MKVFVTGADGMLGSYICRELLLRKYAVKALIEPGRATGTLDGLDLAISPGDILDYQSLITGMGGCDAVIHAAASTQIWPSRSKRIWEINFEGTKLVAKAVLELGLKKLIHIGTANSFGPGCKTHPGTEENPYTDARFKLDYPDSKRAAQETLLELAQSGLPVCVINPGYMFGAYDSNAGTGAMIAAIYQGRITGFTRGGRSFVAAKDVAECIVNALTGGKVAECYLATGYNLNYQEIFTLIAETIAVEPPKVMIPDIMINMVGLFGSISGLISNKPPLISYPLARLSHTDCYYSNEKAVRELGMPQSPLGDAILACFNWLKENNRL